VTLETIVAAWQARQERVRSFKFTWTERQTYTAGAILSERDGVKNPDGLVIPETTTTYDATFTLSVDGDRMRFIRDGIAVSTKKGLFMQRSESVFDGEINKNYMAPGAVEYPRGSVGNEQLNMDVHSVTVFPLLIAFRPFQAAMGRFSEGLDGFALGTETAAVRGRQCVVLKETPNSAGAGVRTVWLDQERDFALLRLNHSTDGRTDWQIDINEHQRQGLDWVPVEWARTVVRPRGSYDLSTTARVAEHHINVPLDEKEFQLEFPPGTWVTDRREKSARGDAAEYILRLNGEKRPITRGDWGASYAQLLESEPGMALVGPAQQGGHLLWLLLGTVAVVLGVVWCRHRRRAAAKGCYEARDSPDLAGPPGT
jgi:hypothetical protein